MRCPACNTYNPPTATTCAGCQAALTENPRKARRRSETPQDVADNPQVRVYDEQVRKLFRLWSWSLVPVVGMVIGPLSAVLSWRLIRRARTDPAFTALR